jgi:D-beta-D-heptose 7-phosphate kinase/D-beta-D-heptose 1-phosphate adenosyltransferase
MMAVRKSSTNMNLPRFDQAKVLVFGDAMLDRYWHGVTSRISPEAPIPVVDVSEIEDRLGGAANVALNIAALGGSASLVAAVGDDEAAEALQRKLHSANITSDLVTISGRPTSTKVRVVSQHQQLVRADFESTAPLPSDLFMAALERCLPEQDALLLSDYDKGVLDEPAAAIALAQKLNKPVLVDPKFKDYASYAGATLVKPNRKEFEAAVGAWQSDEEMVQKAKTMMANLGFAAMLITRGGEGMTLIQRDQTALHLPAASREVFDVSGAGDTVIATLSAAISAGHSLRDAVELCNIAAGIVVAKHGTASVTGPEVRLEVAKHSANQGVMTREQLRAAVAEAQANGEKVVFTNGCFDILHAGHVEYLAEAKQKGNKLIVAINDDDGVKRLKGEGRPINHLERRLTMLAGLAAVDWVVAFEEDTPENLLSEIRPDVLVKGGDYTVAEVVGADIVTAYGGEVAVLKLVDGLSTTALAEKIKRL